MSNVRFSNLSELKKANASIGHFFFSRATMRGTQTQIHGGLIGGRYFVLSIADAQGDERIFKVAGAVDAAGRVAYLERPGTPVLAGFAGEAAAQAYARSLAFGEALAAVTLDESGPESSANGHYVTARDLYLTADNYRELERVKVGTRLMLARHIARGNYDPERAVKAWRAVVNLGAAQYRREFPGTTFSAYEKDLAARMWAADEAAEFNANRWDLAADYLEAVPGAVLGSAAPAGTGTKYDYIQVIRGNFGPCGWEDVAEYARGDAQARADLREYRASGQGVYKLVNRRVLREGVTA